jgi:hypothetical protein
MAEGGLSRLRPQQQALVLRALAMQEAQRMAQSRGQRGALASLAQRFGFPVAPGAQDRLSRLPQDMVAGAPVVGDIASGVGRWAQENPLDAGALAVSPVPVLGDLAGLANDLRHYATDPASRTWGNYALSAAGLLPLVPGVAGTLAKAADNLPMDEASRMARAREMGFDPGVALYRGQPEDYASLRPSERGRFGPGVYASEQPGVAEMYGDFVAPLVGPRDDALFNAMPGARSLDAGARDRIIAQLKPDEVAKLATFEKWYGQDAEAFWEALRRVAGDERASEAISAAGFKGIRGIGDGAETVVFDPRDVRSRFARFDPRNADSADLLAGVAGAGVVGNALLADRDRRSNSGGT